VSLTDGGANRHSKPAAFDGRQYQLGLEPHPKLVRVPNRAPLARSSDPASSHIAAEEFTRSGRRANQKHQLLEWLRQQTRPLTSAEIARDSGLDRHGVARRLPDCERDRLVERHPMRQCTAMGTPAITWKATRS
jgi:hypothetical protein